MNAHCVYSGRVSCCTSGLPRRHIVDVAILLYSYETPTCSNTVNNSVMEVKGSSEAINRVSCNKDFVMMSKRYFVMTHCASHGHRYYSVDINFCNVRYIACNDINTEMTL